MNLKNSGWAFAICRDKTGLVPLNYLVISKSRPIHNNKFQNEVEDVPVPRNSNVTKTHTKRVSFGETQVFENIDLDDRKINENVDLRKPSQAKTATEENTSETSTITTEEQKNSEKSFRG